MDIRGHGHSSHPAKFSSYRIDNLTRDVKQIINAEAVKDFILIGHSWGATIALAYAVNFPQKLKGLVAISGWHLPLHPSPKLVRVLTNNLINLLAFISPPPIKPNHSSYPKGKFHKDYEWLGLTKTIVRNSLKSYLLSLKEAVNLNLQTHIEKINVPTLFIAGTKDTIVHPSIPHKMHSSVKGSRLKFIKGANHVVILNNPKELYTQIQNFLKEI